MQITTQSHHLYAQVADMLPVLTSEQLVQVFDFMQRLQRQASVSKTEENDSLLKFVEAEASADVTLLQVRRALSSISGNLSEVVTQQREERV